MLVYIGPPIEEPTPPVKEPVPPVPPPPMPNLPIIDVEGMLKGAKDMLDSTEAILRNQGGGTSH